MSPPFAPVDDPTLAREAGAAARRALGEAQLALYLVLEGHAGKLTDNQQELLEAVRDALDTVNLEWQKLNGQAAGSRVLAGDRRDPVRLSDLLRDARPQLDAIAARREVRLDLDVAPRRETVLADRSRLQQALAMVLRHVVQHAPRGGQVTVAVAPDARRTGWDIVHEIPVVADADVVLARRIIEGMGGSVEATSDGTAVRFPGATP